MDSGKRPGRATLPGASAYRAQRQATGSPLVQGIIAHRAHLQVSETCGGKLHRWERITGKKINSSLMLEAPVMSASLGVNFYLFRHLISLLSLDTVS